jgi:hypothetical protein
VSISVVLFLSILTAATDKAPAQPLEVFECPRGTLQRGAAPPDGAALWCESKTGTRVGPWRSFWENGKVMDDGQFLNGKHHGKWRSYHPNGKLWRAGNYDKGVEVGVWREWDQDGILKSENRYRNGVVE